MLPVITISREFGSGGHSIGEKTAERLGIPFMDADIIDKAAEKLGYSRDVVEEQGESASGASMIFNVSAAATSYFRSQQDEIYLAQRQIIIDQAEKGPCVIVGRCSDFILKQKNFKVLRVLIHSDMESRKKRILSRYGELQGVNIEKRIFRKDKERSTYYKYYTDQEWGSYDNYDLTLNTGLIGENLSVDLICETARKLS